MKTKLILVLAYMIALGMCMTVFISCNNVTDNDNSFSCYLDSHNKTISLNDVDVSLYSCNEYSSLNNKLYIKLNIINKTNKNIHIQLTDIRTVREATGSSFDYESSVTLDIKAELKENVDLQFEIPTSIKAEKYYLQFDLDGSIIRFYLYNTPDQLLESHTVSYLINGKIVHEEQVLHGKSIPFHEWFSKDGLYYCIEWTNKEIEEFYSNTENRNLSYKVKGNITVNGVKNTILRYASLNSDKHTYVQNLNSDGVTPPNKTLVIPKEYGGKPVRISNLFDAKLKDIEIVYIPNIDRIYTQTFSGTKIKEIHFAGSKEEWAALNVDVPKQIIVYYNSTFN